MLVIGAALQDGGVIDFIAARFARFGTVGLISDIVVALIAGTTTIVVVPLLMSIAFLLSNIVNSAAVAVVVAPLALQLNLLGTGSGRYEFLDFRRLGLPFRCGRLSLIVSLL